MIFLGLQCSHLSDEGLDHVISQIASSLMSNFFKGFQQEVGGLPVTVSSSSLFPPTIAHLPAAEIAPVLRKPWTEQVRAVSVGLQSFLVTSQHCSAPRRGPTNSVCLYRTSACHLEDAEILPQSLRGPAAGLAASDLHGSVGLVPGEQAVPGPHYGKQPAGMWTSGTTLVWVEDGFGLRTAQKEEQLGGVEIGKFISIDWSDPEQQQNISHKVGIRQRRGRR